MTHPLDEIRKEEEKKRKVLEKRRDQMKEKIAKAQDEYKTKLENRKKELAEDFKVSLLEVRKSESEKLKGEIEAKRIMTEKWKNDIHKSGKIDTAVKHVVETFISR